MIHNCTYPTDITREHKAMCIRMFTAAVCNRKMKEEYKNRVDNFYRFKDKNNCKRVYEQIKDL